MDGVLSGSVINSVVEVEIESQICRYNFNRTVAYTYIMFTYRSVSYRSGIYRFCARIQPMTHLAGGSLDAFSQYLSAFRNKGQNPT